LVLDGGSGQIHTLATLSPRKEPQYPLNRRLGGPQSQSGHFGEENGILIEVLMVSVICRDSVSWCSSIPLSVVTVMDAALQVAKQDESLDDVKGTCLQQRPQ
jgi:hypothetical protein